MTTISRAARIRSFPGTALRRLIALSAFLVIIFQYLPGHSYDFQRCDGCHGMKLGLDTGRYYLHTPFARQQCTECHVARVAAPPAGNVVMNSSGGRRKEQQKINWLSDSAVTATTHGFLLPGDQVGDTLVVELHGAGGEFTRHEITTPFPAGLAEVTDSGSPPVISEVRVLDVKRDVFLKVTVGWKTDTFTHGLVRYGPLELSQTSESGTRLSRQHQVVLFNLQPERTYRFAAVSSDLFGRTAVSETLTFSTAQSSTAPRMNHAGIEPASLDNRGLTTRFQRRGKDYLLELLLRQPASVYIGSRVPVRSQVLAAQNPDMLWREDESHTGLSNQAEICLDACQNCHLKQERTTHPVNVYPKPGMTVPAEYPTLPDGRITCCTCHATHGSDNEFLTRKRGKRELCVGCHKDML